MMTFLSLTYIFKDLCQHLNGIYITIPSTGSASIFNFTTIYCRYRKVSNVVEFSTHLVNWISCIINTHIFRSGNPYGTWAAGALWRRPGNWASANRAAGDEKTNGLILFMVSIGVRRQQTGRILDSISDVSLLGIIQNQNGASRSTRSRTTRITFFWMDFCTQRQISLLIFYFWQSLYFLCLFGLFIVS